MNEEKLTCEYCGQVKEKFSFMIGASLEADWVMNEGTGKISCPDCFEIGRKEGQAAVNRHCKTA